MRWLRLAILLSSVVFVARIGARAQQPSEQLPEVIQHDIPKYTPIARTAHLSGEVRVRITTDGESVTNAVAVSGPPLLRKSAEDNARTWKFVPHTPGTFEVTFAFRMLAEKTTFLQNPGVVDIAVLPPTYNEYSYQPLSYTAPEWWELELKTATDDIKAPLRVWTYGPWLRGYTLGRRDQERRLGDPHIEGDMLGFSVALDDSHGQRLQFSLIGRKEGQKIEGIFLDAWGKAGTWTAMPSKPPVSNCATASAAAEDNTIPIPEITQHRQPEYPMLPWEAHIEGQVRMRVTTDNYCVAKITTQSSEPLLAEAAEANVRTWWFGSHEPGTFDVTFIYRFLKPNISFLEKPGRVEIWEDSLSLGGPESGLGNFGALFESEVWNAQLSSPGEHVQLTLHFPYGCCDDGDATDTRSGHKSEIKLGHSAEDKLGFSTIVRLGNNQPTRVSFIGTRRDYGTVQGVFLDESGIRGTWSAKMISHGDAIMIM